jgi:hypothetical protein
MNHITLRDATYIISSYVISYNQISAQNDIGGIREEFCSVENLKISCKNYFSVVFAGRNSTVDCDHLTKLIVG